MPPDPSQGLPSGGGWPQSKIPFTGRWATGNDGQHGWWDGLTERTGLRPRVISRVLTELARADYEMREQFGTDKRGRPIFALAGRRRMTFRVPLLPPRSTPDPATISTPDPATLSTPDPATTRARAGEVAGSGSGLGRQNRHETGAPNVATSFPLTYPPNPDPSRRTPRTGSSGRAAATDDDDQFGAPKPSLNSHAEGTWSGQPGDYETRPRRSPGLGQCTACGEWFVIAAGGRINRHNGTRPDGSYGTCPGARQPPARPVRCTGPCGRTELALASLTGMCAACTRERKAATP